MCMYFLNNQAVHWFESFEMLQNIVELFAKLDKDGSGQLELADLEKSLQDIVGVDVRGDEVTIFGSVVPLLIDWRKHIQCSV